MKTDEFFEKFLKELENKPDEKGHYDLLKDLWGLWQDAVNHEFHDFKNNKYPAPKMALHTKLNEIDKKMQDGDYDN